MIRLICAVVVGLAISMPSMAEAGPLRAVARFVGRVATSPFRAIKHAKHDHASRCDATACR